MPSAARKSPGVPGSRGLVRQDLSPLADGTSSARTERALGARFQFRVWGVTRVRALGHRCPGRALALPSGPARLAALVALAPPRWLAALLCHGFQRKDSSPQTACAYNPISMPRALLGGQSLEAGLLLSACSPNIFVTVTYILVAVEDRGEARDSSLLGLAIYQYSRKATPLNGLQGSRSQPGPDLRNFTTPLNGLRRPHENELYLQTL